MSIKRELMFEEKVQAIHSLSKRGNSVTWRYDTLWADHVRWYAIADDLEITDGHIISSAMGRGRDPEGALNDLWRELTLPGKWVAIDVLGERRAVRWTGFMWEPVDEKAEVESNVV